jgi:hypothetical protein
VFDDQDETIEYKIGSQPGRPVEVRLTEVPGAIDWHVLHDMRDLIGAERVIIRYHLL